MFRDWDKQLSDQVHRDFKNYHTLRIDLSTARDNEVKVAAGGLIYVWDMSSKAAAASIRFNRTVNDAIDLKLHTKIETIFTQFFITNIAQAGEWIELLIGIDFDITNVFENPAIARPAVIITNVAADTNTVGAAAITNKVLVKALSTNSGIVWLNIGAAAVEGSCYDLAPGSAIALRTSNTDQINVLFKTANDNVCVIREI